MAVLLLAHTVPVAVAAAILIGAGTAMNGPALTHYPASSTALLNQVVVSRLRLVDSLGQGLMPVLAGGLIDAGGRDLGFLVSLGCYGSALLVMASLPSVAGTREPELATGERPWARLRLPRPVVEQMAVGGVIAALSWLANVLHTAYILVTLHASALRYGLALGV